jgi:serine/threonine protein kinase
LLGRFIDVCEAIAFAHNKGVLHRDLKPHNVMLGRFGETLLIDWGLAKATGLRAPASPNVPREPTLVPASAGIYPATEGVLGGTPGYMSPEQAMTEARALGPATDIYGLGAILFQLLTSRPPVVGLDPNDIMARTIQGAVRSPRSLNPRVPRELEAVCLKALAPRWADRYPTAEALAEDIEHWLADEPVSAFPETPLQRLGRWNRKHRAVTRIAFFALGVTMVAISWPLWQAASNRIWAQENEAAAELILKDTHKIFREYENSPLKILNNLPVPILKNLPSALARPISDPLVRQAIADVVKEYKKTHTATGNRFLAGTTLYNRVISAMLSHTAEIESRMPGMLLDALMNLEESVTCQERAVALETANRPRIDDWLGFNLDNIKQYQTDLLEYYSRLVTILVRLDQGNAAKDRVDECLDRFRDSPKQLEEFAQFLKKRADELDRDAPRRELMTAELDKFIDDARRAQAVSNRSATRPAVTTVSPRDDFQEEAIKALVRSGPASPASGRQQALKWLRADLQLRKRQLASDDASTRQRARAFLRSWQTADGLAALREGAERTRLPEAEARECQSFWSDVESVLE